MTTPTTIERSAGAETVWFNWLVDPLLLMDDETRARLARPVALVDVAEEFPRTEAACAQKDQGRS